ncbi:MAG: GntR family transcriptional regulator [Spirochaetales bacterium]
MMKTRIQHRITFYREICDYIEESIRKGELTPHQKLPSTEELCVQFNVSKITIEKAMKCLTQEKLIYRIPGKGSFVSELEMLRSEDLKRQTKGYIAFVCPSVRSHHVMNILSEIEETSVEFGYRTLLCLSKGSCEKQGKILNSLVQEEVDGIIVYPTEGEYYDEVILRLSLSKFPLVLVDKKFDKIKISSITSDHLQGAYQGTRKLIEKGHKQIAFISTYSPDNTSTIRDRLLGFSKAMEEAKIGDYKKYILAGFFHDFDHPISYDLNSRQLILEEIKLFLKKRPEITAILSMSPGNFSYVAKALKELDPSRVNQIEFAIFDVDEDLDYSKHPLLIISQQSREMGKLAVQILFNLIRNPEAIQSTVLPMEVKYL